MIIAWVVIGAYAAVFLTASVWQAASWVARIATGLLPRRRAPKADPSSTPQVVVTLVHGTFARRADWTQESSGLCRTIRERIHGPVRFEQFLWSGWNTVTSRSVAVERLILHLDDTQARWPQARHFVIGHSHGGNIALQAMREEAVEARTAGIVCLSTPFLCASPRDLGPVGRIARWWFPVVVALFCLVPAVELLPSDLQDDAGAVATLVAIGFGFIVAPRLGKFAASVAGRLQLPDVSPHKVLIVRSFGDEASAALGAAHMISWIAERIWSRTSRFIGASLDTVETWRSALVARWRPLVATCTVLLGLAVLPLAVAERQTWMELSGLLAAAMLAVVVTILIRGGYAAFLGALLLAVLATPFFLIILLLGIATGPELLIAALLFRVTAESTPPGGGWSVWQVPRDPWHANQVAALMHSTTYDDEESLAIVSRWLKELTT